MAPERRWSTYEPSAARWTLTPSAARIVSPRETGRRTGMRLKVLGAYGASDAEHNLTGYLLDDWFAVDAGTLTSKLSLAQQGRIQAVYITHSHADHIRDLPHLILNRHSQNTGPLTIFAARDVMDLLTENVFNGTVWPDFATISAPHTGKPPVQYRALIPGKKVMFNDVALTA